MVSDLCFVMLVAIVRINNLIKYQCYTGNLQLSVVYLIVCHPPFWFPPSIEMKRRWENMYIRLEEQNTMFLSFKPLFYKGKDTPENVIIFMV